MNIRFLIILFVVNVFLGCTQNPTSKFIRVDGITFTHNGMPYEFVGTNFWYGAYLGRSGEEGNRERLLNELDFLKKHGITNLRILGASEESVFKNSLSPTFTNADGTHNNELLVGLDFLLSEMAKRDIHGVIFMNNFWEWSGV